MLKAESLYKKRKASFLAQVLSGDPRMLTCAIVSPRYHKLFYHCAKLELRYKVRHRIQKPLAFGY